MSSGGGGGGGGGPIQQATAPAVPGAAYTPVQRGPVYQPQYQQYQPQYQQYQPQQTAPQQQMQMPSYQSGLQAAMMHMMQQYNRPMMRAPMRQGISQSSPMAYRPSVVNNTNNVAPSVEVQQRLAAEAKAKWDAEHPANAPDSSGVSYSGSSA